MMIMMGRLNANCKCWKQIEVMLHNREHCDLCLFAGVDTITLRLKTPAWKIQDDMGWHYWNWSLKNSLPYTCNDLYSQDMWQFILSQVGNVKDNVSFHTMKTGNWTTFVGHLTSTPVTVLLHNLTPSCQNWTLWKLSSWCYK